MENLKHREARKLLTENMFQKQILNLGLVFPLCYSSVGTLQLPVCSQIFMSVSSVKIEHSRSAGSSFLSWGKTVAWAATTSRMQWTSVHHISPVSYSLSLKAHLIIIKVIKRRKYIMKCTFMILQSSSAKERFGHSDSSWRAAQESGTAEGRTAIHTLPAHLCSWCKMHVVLPSFLHFSFSSSMRTTWILDHFSQWSCRERNWKNMSYWSGGLCLRDVLGSREGGAPQPCPLEPPFLPIPSQLREFKISFSKSML